MTDHMNDARAVRAMVTALREDSAPEPDWELTTIEISCEASGGDGGGDEAPAAPPPNATWQLGEIQIGDDDD